MRMHFWIRHVQDTVIIPEEGNLPLPRYENCDMLVPWRALNGRHKDTAMCRSRAEWKRRRLAEVDIREITERAFEAYGEQLELVPRFTYLGRVMTAGDDDWPSVAGNLAKARRNWGRLQRILGRKGATARISGDFFKAVVQQVLLFGAEMWVVTPKMEQALSGFLHGAARRLTGRQARRGKNGAWHYPSLEGAMREIGMADIRKSIANRQNTVAQYIATRPLLYLCKGARAREGARMPMRWWNQAKIDWETAKSKGGETDSTSVSGTDTDGEEEREEEWEDASKASGSSGAEWSGASADEWE